MDHSLGLIEQAVYRLFDPTVPAQEQQQIHEWIFKLVEQPQSWITVWELLDVQRDTRCHFVGASMLQTKINSHMRDLSPEELQDIRVKLTTNLMRHQSPQILSKLTIALSDFAAKTLCFFWKTAVSDMIENLKNVQPLILLEFLNCLPSRAIKEFDRAGQSLTPYARDVLHLSCTALTDPALQEMALQTISQWVCLDSLEAVPTDLCNKLLEQIPEHHEMACEAITSYLAHPELNRHPETLTASIVRIFLVCREVLEVRRAENDHEALLSIYYCVSGIGEVHGDIILANLEKEHRYAMESFFKMMLDCTSFPGFYPVDEVLSRVTISVWHILLDELERLGRDLHGRLSLRLYPVYEELVKVLLQKSSLPDMTTYDADEKEDFRCYRQDIADCYSYVYSLLALSMLQYGVQELETAVMNYGRDQNWRRIEACLFLINSIGDMVDGAENAALVERVLNVLPQIPSANDELLLQVMSAIGVFAEKTSGENYYAQVRLLLRGLQQPGISAAAGIALRDLVVSLSESITPIAFDILNTIEAVLQSFVQKHTDRVRLISIVGLVVVETGSCEQSFPIVSKIMSPFIVQLSRPYQPAHRQLFVESLGLLQALFSQWVMNDNGHQMSETSKLGVQLLQQLFPILTDLANKCLSDEQVITALAECLRKAVPVLDTRFPCPILLDLFKLCVFLQGNSINSASLKCATSVLTHAKGNHIDVLCEPFHTLNVMCLDSFKRGNLQERTDQIEAFYLMHAALLKKKLVIYRPEVLTVENMIDLCKFASLGTMLPEKPTFRACINFLTHFVKSTESSPYLKQAFEACGESILFQLIQNMHGGVPRRHIELQADVFLAMNKHALPQFSLWLNKFAQAPTTLAHMTQESRVNFKNKLLRERSNKQVLIELVADFTRQWRNLDNEYGRMTDSSRLSLH